MIKKSFVVLILSLFLFSIFLVGSVSAQCFTEEGNAGYDIKNKEDCNKIAGGNWIEPATDSSFSIADVFESFDPSFGNLADWVRIYEQGQTPDKVLLKYLFLALIITLIYSALAQVEFPDNAGLRLVIAVIVGLLSTIAIKPEEFIALLSSYTALGVTLILFIPIIILLFLTITVAIRANPIGILMQKMLWIIYSAYLFITSGASLIITYTDSLTIKNVATFLGGQLAGQGAGLIPLMLFISSIAIFVIAVMGNKFLIEWTAKEMREADMERYKDTGKRSRAAREADANLTRRREEL